MNFISQIISTTYNYIMPAKTPENVQKEVKGETKEKELHRIFYGNMKIHHAAEKSEMMQSILKQPQLEVYFKYIERQKSLFEIFSAGLRNINKFEKTAGQEHFNWLKDFVDIKFEALKKDAAAYRVEGVEIKTENYKKQLTCLAQTSEEEPYKLLMHVGIWLYAVLHGGQSQLKTLQKTWPDGSFEFYKFDAPATTVIKKLSDVYDRLGSVLSAEEFEACKKEAILAWICVGDVIEHDVREIASKELEKMNQTLLLSEMGNKV